MLVYESFFMFMSHLRWCFSCADRAEQYEHVRAEWGLCSQPMEELETAAT